MRSTSGDELLRDRRAEAQQGRAQFAGELELPLGPVEIAPALRLGRALEIAERLQGDDVEAEVVGERPCVPRRAGIEGQVVFEQLDRPEARLGRRGKLGLEPAAETDRRDRPSEHCRKSPRLLETYDIRSEEAIGRTACHGRRLWANPSSTLTETLRERLRQDIILGSLPPASKLKLEALSRSYNVSVNTMRETLSRLSADGLVVAEGQKGFAVLPVSVEDLREITEMRQPVWNAMD